MLPELRPIERHNARSLTMVVRLFACKHWKVLTTGDSRWCWQCAKEKAGERYDGPTSLGKWIDQGGGWMESKVVGVIEFELDEDDELKIKKVL